MASAPPKRGLGKGLGALIPSGQADEPVVVPSAVAPATTAAAPIPAPEAEALARYAELPIESIVPNPRQPRAVFDEDALAELVFSIREIGLLQPIVVRASGEGYELVAGERRLRASREAGLTRIPAIVRQTEDEAMLRDALLENLHRANLNPLEEAAAYQQMLSDFGCTQEQLAARIGRSRPQVTNTLRLLKLPPDVQRRVAAGVLSAGHARALLSLDDPAAMDAMATRIVAEGLSVRAVEEIIIVGDGDGRQRTKSRRSRVSLPQESLIADVVRELTSVVGDQLDTRVSADGFTTKKSKGRLLIECADIEDLRRITDAIRGA